MTGHSQDRNRIFADFLGLAPFLNTMFPNFNSAGVQKGHILASSKLVTIFILLQLKLRPTVLKMSQTHTCEGFTWLAFFKNFFFMTASFEKGISQQVNERV